MPVSQIVYYDGQFDDARLNVALACTAALTGATVLNHAKVIQLLKVRQCTLVALQSHRAVQSHVTWRSHCAQHFTRQALGLFQLRDIHDILISCCVSDLQHMRSVVQQLRCLCLTRRVKATKERCQR